MLSSNHFLEIRVTHESFPKIYESAAIQNQNMQCGIWTNLLGDFSAYFNKSSSYFLEILGLDEYLNLLSQFLVYSIEIWFKNNELWIIAIQKPIHLHGKTNLISDNNIKIWPNHQRINWRILKKWFESNPNLDKSGIWFESPNPKSWFGLSTNSKFQNQRIFTFQVPRNGKFSTFRPSPSNRCFQFHS